MPRGPRLDFPGALHHVIARGIERRRIFLSDEDRSTFLDRLSQVVTESTAGLYAWALLSNHFHLLLRSGRVPLGRLMQRLLGGYVRTFNHCHRRTGHLFQNRFKSILVEEEPYLLELVRYIHLNPFRAHVVESVEDLGRYRWAGHAVLLGRQAFAAQDRDFVLEQFGVNTSRACRAYRLFIEDGAHKSSPVDLSGGGLRRSAGGWERVNALRRGRERWAFDERILGGSDFVQEVLAETERAEVPEHSVVEMSALCSRVAKSCQLNESEVLGPSLRRPTVKARAMVSFIAVRQYGLSLSTVARHLRVSPQSVARGVAAGEFLLHGRTSLVNRMRCL